MSSSAHRPGYTLTELVITIAMAGILTTLGIGGYVSVRSWNNVRVGTASVAESWRTAQSYAQQINENNDWGVYLTSTTITLFQGQSYSARVTSADRILALPSGLTVSGLTEVRYSRLSGTTSTPGTVTISSGQLTSTLTLNAKGTITYN